MAGPMSTLAIGRVADQELTIDARLVDGAIVVALTGTADVRSVAHLQSLVPQLHAEAVRLGSATVIVDLRALKLMDIACLRTLVTLIGLDEALPPETQYRIVLRGTPAFPWQRRSLHAL